ncbi:MAG: TolC family protein [Novosphingobium sp.]
MRRLILPLVTLSCLAAASPAAAQDLAAAITDALANAPTLAEANAGEAAAKARLDRARAESNPLLRVEGSYGAGRIDNGGFFGIAPANVNPLAVQAVAEMPIYAGDRISSAIDQARGGAEMARFGAEQARLQTIVLAVSTYTDVLTSRKLEARYSQLVSDLVETERQAGLRFHAGEIASSELAQARARKAEADAGFAQAQGRRASAEAAYQRLTGKPAGDLAPLPDLPPIPPSLDQALDMARTSNPALRQAKAGVDVARAGVRSAKAEGMPTVGAFAEAAHVRDQFFPGYKADSVAVGVRGRWTLFAGGRVSSQIRAADADLDGSEARLRQADQALEGMVIDAWQGLVTARRMTEASHLRRDATVEALRGTRLEAQVGAKPTLAVLDAEREAIEGEAALLQAEGMQTVAAWRLNALTGNIAPGNIAP